MTTMKQNKTEMTVEQIQQTFPDTYDFLQELGSGSFGQVFKCLKKDTKEIVAVKLPFYREESEREAFLLKIMMEEGMDKCNIVKFIDSFDTSFGPALVLEMLDMNLQDYCRNVKSLPMCHIRAIVKQMATALETLKSIGLIHADIKPNNIMLCDHTRNDFKVKLIDFGVAMHCTEVKKDMVVQNRAYRAPEVILGIQFGEAIDMWALGTVVANLVLGFEIFPDRPEFEVLKVIVKLCGQPPDQVLDEGTKTDLFFCKKKIGKLSRWKLMNNEEFITFYNLNRNYVRTFHSERYSSLEELIKAHVKVSQEKKLIEREDFIDLLRQMLETNHVNRIKPTDILKHPFIINERYCSVESSTEKTETSQVQTKSAPVTSGPAPRVMKVKPARPEITAPLAQDEKEHFSVNCGKEKRPKERANTPVSSSPGPRVTMVKAANPKSTAPLVKDKQECLSEQCEMETLTTEGIKKIILQVLEEGQFGQVVKCQEKDNQTVAVKLPNSAQNPKKEGLDQHNVGKYHEEFDSRLWRTLVFEKLDMSLAEYFNHHGLMPFSDIRSTIQQVATALEALKTAGVIHTNIKLENVMLCDHTKRPFEVKLTGFGSAMYKTKAKQGMLVQNVKYRAPEVILGLPFNEAIDVWSLGNMMASMFLGFDIFPERTEFEALKVMVKLFDQLPDQILDKGRNTILFFNYIGKSWKFKTVKEYEKCHKLSPGDIKTHLTEAYSTLIELIVAYAGPYLNNREELFDFLDLLHCMLQMNEAHRFTPAQILRHAFISKGQSCAQSEMEENPEQQQHVNTVQDKTRSSPKVILVKPASPENTLSLDEDNEDCVSVQSGPEKTVENVSLVHEKPNTPVASSPASGVIMVKAATPENTFTLIEDDQEQFSVKSGPEKTPEKNEHFSRCSSEPRVIVVKMATPENTTTLDEDEKEPKPTPETESNVLSNDAVSEVFTGVVATKKKKKKGFRRIFSWMRKNLCCFCADVEEE